MGPFFFPIFCFQGAAAALGDFTVTVHDEGSAAQKENTHIQFYLCQPKRVTVSPRNGLVVLRVNTWEKIVHLHQLSVHPTMWRWAKLFCQSDGAPFVLLIFRCGTPTSQDINWFPVREVIAECVLSVSRPALKWAVKHVVIMLLTFHMSQLTVLFGSVLYGLMKTI